MSEGIVYFCERCGDQLRPDDDVIQTVRIVNVDIEAGSVPQESRGGWFHVTCDLQPSHEEVARGHLAEVLERA